MKTVALDKLCRIVIPVAYRSALQIDKGDALTMCMENGAIIIRPARETCRVCGAPIAKKAPLPLCRDCIAKVKKTQ